MTIQRRDLIRIIIAQTGLRSYKLFVPDDEYILPSLDEVQSLVKKTWFENYTWLKDFFDCDDFEMITSAFVRQQRYYDFQKGKIQIEKLKPWALGGCFAKKLEGKKLNHAVNIFVDDTETVYFLEPQNDRIWKCEREETTLYYCRI